jgi:hypothetical protein
VSSTSLRRADAPMGVRLHARRRRRAVRVAAPRRPAPPRLDVPRVLRRRHRAQSQSLADVHAPPAEHPALDLDIVLLRVSRLRVDSDPQPEPPQVHEPAGRRVDHLASHPGERPLRRRHVLLRRRGGAGSADRALRRAGEALEPEGVRSLPGAVRLRLRRARGGDRARDRAPRPRARRVGVRVGPRRPRARRALGPHVHQLRPARRLRPVVVVESLARLHVALDERARLRQRLPHRAPRAARPALE